MSLETAARIIDPIRAVAWECGYAVAIHGTLDRDIDLVAIPWMEVTSDVNILLGRVCRAARGRMDLTGWRKRPHGRLVCCIRLEGKEYIDFSVTPREKK